MAAVDSTSEQTHSVADSCQLPCMAGHSVGAGWSTWPDVEAKK